MDYGAFPVGGFVVRTQPPGATVDLAGTTGGIIDDAFGQAGLE